MTTAPAVWYLMRASGIVALLLLTVSFALGIATSNRWRPRGVPLFVTTTLHRNASLLAVVFLAVHVVTAAIDPDAQVGLLAVVVPFAGSFWVALGAISLDLVAALVVTSLLRRRLSYRRWRAIHWSAYGAWPLALLHGFGMGSDTATIWLAAVNVACILTVGGVLAWRILVADPGDADRAAPRPAGAGRGVRGAG